MKLDNPILQKLLAGAWYSFAAILVLAALLLTAARVLLPYVDSYRQEIEQLASESSGQPVRIAEMKAEWRGFTPYLIFTNIDLMDEQAEKSLLNFKSASAGIHLWQSLYEQRLIVSNFTVSGMDLHVTRRKSGYIEIHGLETRGKQYTTEESEVIARWLFSRTDIGIEDSQLAWTDEFTGHDTLVFSNVRLKLRNDEDRHQIEGNIVLPKHYGKSLSLALDVTGDTLNPRDWKGSLYVKGVDLKTNDLAGVLSVSDLSLQSAVVDIEAWSEWQRGKLLNLQGKILIDDIVLTLGEAQSKIRRAAMYLNWLREEQGWKLQVNDIAIKSDKKWPVSNFVVSKKYADQQYDMQLSYLQLDDVMPVVAASGVTEAFTKQLKGMQLAGDVHDIHVRFARSGELSVAARLQGVSNQPWKDIPGVKNLDAEISGSAEKGRFSINSNNLVLDAPKIFNNILEFNEVTATAGWKRDVAGYHLDVTAFHVGASDVSSNGQLRLDLGDSKSSPVIDLQASFKGKNAENTVKYLPAKVMNKKAVKWITGSIKAGTVPGGGIIFKGPIDKFPFKNKEGVFKVSFNVIDGLLDYVPGWPMIRDAQANVEFDGPAMKVTSTQGRIYDTELHDVVVVIPDVKAAIPVVSFKGTSKGSSADALKYILEAGIAGKREKGLERLKVSGNTSINLAMDIPMHETIANTSKGSFTFEDSAIWLKGVKNKKHRLDAINGKVSFKDTDFSSRGIKASLYGKPLTVDVDSHIEASSNLPAAAVRIRARGKLDLNTLLQKRLDKNIPGFIEGEDRWQITLRLPEDADEDTHWSVSSRLLDSVVTLPAPLIKAKGESRFLKLAGTLPDNNIMNLWLHYGSILNGVVSVDTDKNYLPRSGELHFGDVPATLPDKPGIVVRGSIAKLSLDTWQNWLETRVSPEKKQASRDFFPVRDVDLVFANIGLGRHSLNNVHINGSKGPSGWLLDIESDRATGKISIPNALSQLPIKLDLSKLKLPKSEEDGPQELSDPRKLPALELRVSEFFYDDTSYGELELVLIPQLQGSFIKSLRMESPELLINATGDWQIDESLEQITRLNAKVRSDDLGIVLKKFEYAEVVDGGSTRVNAQLQWKGGPLDFSFVALVGTTAIEIKKGQLRDVEPGAGRVFGLLSLTTLPRRLTLDFSDLFKKGFSFDVIKGDFTFDEGDAYTTNLYLDGPPARIDTSGRIGLKTEDYDQLVTVTPKLTASLPVAGAIVGGPVAGGVLFAVEKMFGRRIDKISRFQYTMTGSWDEPVITKLGKDPEQVTADAVNTE